MSRAHDGGIGPPPPPQRRERVPLNQVEDHYAHDAKWKRGEGGAEQRTCGRKYSRKPWVLRESTSSWKDSRVLNTPMAKGIANLSTVHEASETAIQTGHKRWGAPGGGGGVVLVWTESLCRVLGEHLHVSQRSR